MAELGTELRQPGSSPQALKHEIIELTTAQVEVGKCQWWECDESLRGREGVQLREGSVMFQGLEEEKLSP